MNNPNAEAQKGDILWAENNKNRSGRSPHYMIFIGPHSFDPDLFIGVMITHSRHFNNVPLDSAHFERVDKNGKKFLVVHDQSLIVGNPLIKKVEWLPFHKVGQLSPEGVAFIEKVIWPHQPGVYGDNL